MARMARVVLAGIPHHVTQRGVRSMRVFYSDGDRREYLRLMNEEGERFGVQFLSYCLMSNHVHLVAVPRQPESLARAIGEAHRRYTRGVNFRQGVRGYLFQGRFFSCPVDERHLLAAVRYVEQNPVRARMVRRAWDYEWSSARFHVGAARADPLVVDRSLLGLVDRWRSFLREDENQGDLLRQRTRTGRPCGSPGFLRWSEKRTGRRLQPRPAGRPKKK